MDRNVAPYMDAKPAQTLREDYAAREVVYLLGSEDTDRSHQYLSRDCEADLQGYHRFQRGLNYLNHMDDLAARSVIPSHRHRVAKVLGTGHWSREMYGSATGRAVLFGSLIDGDANGVDDSVEDTDGDGFIANAAHLESPRNQSVRSTDVGKDWRESASVRLSREPFVDRYQAHCSEFSIAEIQ